MIWWNAFMDSAHIFKLSTSTSEFCIFFVNLFLLHLSKSHPHHSSCLYHTCLRISLIPSSPLPPTPYILQVLSIIPPKHISRTFSSLSVTTIPSVSHPHLFPPYCYNFSAGLTISTLYSNDFWTSKVKHVPPVLQSPQCFPISDKVKQQISNVTQEIPQFLATACLFSYKLTWHLPPPCFGEASRSPFNPWLLPTLYLYCSLCSESFPPHSLLLSNLPSLFGC